MSESENRRAPERPDYVPFTEATEADYQRLGFMCGLEIHQQLATTRKLFCRCPAGLYHAGDAFDAQLVRHMRPTLSELGEYDGTALMEFKTRKNITYRIKGETTCTYDIDDTPPFPLNREALDIGIRIALLLKLSIVGELHITRKQYLDGSIPTGFQRTAIIGIEGEIPLSTGIVRILQLSIEEDSCREVRDVGHERIYTTDRLGIPLAETVTHPDMKTPTEAAEAAQYLRYLARSTGKVNTGIGATRQDVNVSIEGGTRVEIKGVQRIRWIPQLTHNEAFRQNALLSIRDALLDRIPNPDRWQPESVELPTDTIPGLPDGHRAIAIRLSVFGDILTTFTSPGRCFADELSDQLKVVACIEKPNLALAGAGPAMLDESAWSKIRKTLRSEADDALVVVWGPERDLPTAIETIEERCRWAFLGVPNETRKAMPDGTTIFERVLPGPDRMYPDTDSAPIPINEDMIASARSELPTMTIAEQIAQLRAWRVPDDTDTFILRNDLFNMLQQAIDDASLEPRFAGTLIGHVLRNASAGGPIDQERFTWVVRETVSRKLEHDILRSLVPLAVEFPEAPFDALLKLADYEPRSEADVVARIAELLDAEPIRSSAPSARRDWMMGRLRTLAIGNLPLRKLATTVEEALR